MDHQAVLKYLDNFVNDPRVVTYSSLPESEKQTLPHSWQNILSAQGSERVARTVAQWDTYRPDFDDLPDDSDPLMDLLAERHAAREERLFAS